MATDTGDPQVVSLTGGMPPVEHRRFGMDRRTFGLPLVVVGIAVLWAVVMPLINGSVDFDDPVRAGDALWVGQGVSMAPPVGWGIERGVRTSADVRARNFDKAFTEVIGNGLTVTTEAGKFRGDSAALLSQVIANDETSAPKGAFTISGPRETLTVDRRRGVAQEIRGSGRSGAIFAFAQGGQGLTIVVVGESEDLQRNTTAIGRMIASLTFDVPEA